MTSSTCLRHDPRQAWMKQTDYRSPLKAIAKICQTHNLKQIIGYLCYHGNKSSPRPNSVTTTPAIKKRKKHETPLFVSSYSVVVSFIHATLVSVWTALPQGWFIYLHLNQRSWSSKWAEISACVYVCARAVPQWLLMVCQLYISLKDSFISCHSDTVSCASLFIFVNGIVKKCSAILKAFPPLIHTLQHRQLVPEQFQDQFENATVYKSHLAGTETEWRECVRNPALLRLCSNPVKDSMHTLFLGSALKLKVASLEYE